MNRNQNERAVQRLSGWGRGGDTTMAHLTPGEVVIPLAAQDDQLMSLIAMAMKKKGINPAEFMVGHKDAKVNPNTGAQEFFSPTTIDTSAKDPREAWVAAQVENLYNTVLGRASEEEGKKYWVEKLMSGEIDFNKAQDAFLNSEENLKQHAGDQSALVKEVYQTKLGREADAGGLDAYTKLGDVNQVISSINNSDERKQYLQGGVNNVYQTILGREGEEQGLKYWQDRNMTQADLGLAFINSDEYRRGKQAEWYADKVAAADKPNMWGSGYTVEPGAQKTADQVYAERYKDELGNMTAQEHWQKIGQFKGYDYGIQEKKPGTVQPGASGGPSGTPPTAQPDADLTSRLAQLQADSERQRREHEAEMEALKNRQFASTITAPSFTLADNAPRRGFQLLNGVVDRDTGKKKLQYATNQYRAPGRWGRQANYSRIVF